MQSATYTKYVLEANSRDIISKIPTPSKWSSIISVHTGQGTFVDPEFFRWMYNRVGKPYNWWYFSNKTEEELKAYLHDKTFYTLMLAETPIGFAITEFEFDTNSINLSYFGLTPAGITHGIRNLGSYFLLTVLSDWIYDSSKFWVYTTSWDHPAAIPCYKKAGFSMVSEESVTEQVPDWVANGVS